jgi:hypothetical protein
MIFLTIKCTETQTTSGSKAAPLSMVLSYMGIDFNLHCASIFPNTKSNIYIRNNKRPISVMSRINIVEERIHFLNINGVENYATSPIEEIQFFEDEHKATVFVFGLPGCSSATRAWYEVMEKGKINLFRMVNKNVQESKTYGSATTDQKISTTYNYWIQQDNTCSQLKNIAEFQSLLIKANPALKEKLPARKLSDKKEADWVDLASIYNAL